MTEESSCSPMSDYPYLDESDDLEEVFGTHAEKYALKFKQLGRVEDINRSIELWEKYLLMLPSNHSSTPRVLNGVGVSRLSRFEQIGGLQDLEMAIEELSQSVSLTPNGHPDKPIYLSNLGSSLGRRFTRLGELQDIERAIEVLSHSVSFTPDSHPNRRTYLSNLGTSLGCRFERLGELQDLERAIEVLSQSVSLTPNNHSGKPVYLHNLGNMLQHRFKRLGGLQDIERAIDVYARSISLTPNGHPTKPGRLIGFGGSLQRQFQWLGGLQDIKRAIEVCAQSVSLTSDVHPSKPGYLMNLGDSLQGRFEWLGDLQDIERATEVRAQSVSLTPDGHPDKPLFLNNFGNSLVLQFKRLGELQDIERAIEVFEQSISLTPDGHPEKPGRLHNLGCSLQHRFKRLGDLQDIERAIEIQAQCISLTPDDHPDTSLSLSNLGTSYKMRFRRLKDMTDIDKAINLFSKAATSTTGKSSVRFKAARQWIDAFQLNLQYTMPEKLQAHSVLVRLVPGLIWLGLPVSKRYQVIMEELGLSINDAAATAIEAGKFQLAIEWMEQGRSIIRGQLMSLCSPLDDLYAYDATLAGNLELFSRQLKIGGFQGIFGSRLQGDFDHLRPPGLEEQARNYRRIVHEREQLLKEIRSLPGFERFLLPQEYAQLSIAACNSVIVIINVSRLRCDALVLSHPSSSPTHIHLPDFSHKKAEVFHSSLLKSLKLRNIRAREPCRKGYSSSSKDYADLQSVVGELWLLVVQPIVQGIEGFLFDDGRGHLPHITWCPTGHLSFLSLHAAGNYSSDDHRISLLDLAVSSYIPTLTTMLNLQTKRTQGSAGSPRMLLVTQPNTPGHSALPGTLREAKIIKQEIFKESDECRHLTREQATPCAVLDAMDKYDWVHFACHGTQEFKDPINSAFILHDGKLELHRIMNKFLGNAQLAFLSACETSTGDEKLPEEAVHLASGMLAAGYSQVIGTMWSIGDEDAPRVVESFYKDLLAEQAAFGTGSSGSHAMYALHKAVKRLCEEVGETNFIRWVPFVHFGI